MSAVDSVAEAVSRLGSSETAYPPAIADAEPRSDPTGVWRLASRLATIGIFLILLTGGLIAAAPICVPIACALILGCVAGPAADRLAAAGVHPALTALASVVLLFAIFYGLVLLAAAPLTDWLTRVPEISSGIKARLAGFDGPLGAFHDLRRAYDELVGANTQIKVDAGQGDIVPGLLSAVPPRLGQVALFLGTLAFFLIGRTRLRLQLVVMFVGREARLTALRTIKDVERSLARYFATVTMINLGLGIVTAIAMAILGLPNPALWGVVVAILNFVPFVGPAVAIATLLVAGLVSFPDLGTGILPAVVFLALILVEGQVIAPNVIGRRMTLNPIAVLLALAFWIWVWGPVGAFVAVPLLVVGTVVVDHLFPTEELNLPG